MQAHDADLRLLIDAVHRAADIALRHHGRDPATYNKSDRSPVTEADLEVDQALREMLTEARPTYGWLSEETPDTTDRLARARVFILDPIDGTRNFMEAGRSWCHSLAIVENGRPIKAALLQPLRDRLYTAQIGHGATLNGTPLNKLQRVKRDPPTILAAKSIRGSGHWLGEQPKFDIAYRPSLAYRLALVAEGRFDGIVTLRDAWEWDIAAGALLLQEAGATVTGKDGLAIAFNQPTCKSNGFVAAEPNFHGTLIAGLTGISP